MSAAPVSASPTPTPSPAARTIPEQLADSAGTLQSVVQRAKKVGQLRKGAATVPVQAPAPGLVRVSIVGRTKVDGKFPVIAVGSKTTPKAGRVNVTIKRTPDGREILRSGEPIEATLVVCLFYRGGKVVTTGLPITLD